MGIVERSEQQLLKNFHAAFSYRQAQDRRRMELFDRQLLDCRTSCKAVFARGRIIRSCDGDETDYFAPGVTQMSFHAWSPQLKNSKLKLTH